MVALIDFDSILYQSVYKIVSFTQMRDAIEKYEKEGARLWLKEEISNEATNRCENTLLKMQEYLQSIMPFGEEITSVELFITTCSNSFRKKLTKTYKANRKKNKWVDMVRNEYMMQNMAKYSDTLEADDLISIRANQLGLGNCIVVSIDKDLKQIGGYFWSYQQQKEKDVNGDFVLDEYGNPEKSYKYKEVEYISKEKANYLFWQQMLMGDTSDNIKGLHRVGIKTAEKILKDSKVHWIKAAREYIKRNQKTDWKINYQLLKLKT